LDNRDSRLTGEPALASMADLGYSVDAASALAGCYQLTLWPDEEGRRRTRNERRGGGGQ
jgi:hypothetical protein